MKTLLTISLLSFLITFLSCSSTHDAERNLKGSILTVGNEPFTSLALKVGENEIYLLKTEDKEQEVELKANQGKYYIISYDNLKTYISGDTIHVKRIQPAN